MTNYHLFMAGQIAEEIKHVDDPLILCIYLKAIIAARCKIGGAKEGTCKGCMFQGHYCRELNQICDDELRRFNCDVEKTNETI